MTLSLAGGWGWGNCFPRSGKRELQVQLKIERASHFSFQTKQLRRQLRLGFFSLHFRVARWYVFKPKINPVWVNSEGPYNGKIWYILWLFGIFTAVWSSLWPFGNVVIIYVYFFPVWYIVSTKIWQPCFTFQPNSNGCFAKMTLRNVCIHYVSKIHP
jgi:hypothetical protein